MKKVIFIFLLLFPIKVIGISASSYIVADLDNDRYFYGSNINEEHLIASTTKIMTALVTITVSDINKEVEVGNEVLKAYGSAIYIEPGEKITIRDLLYGLMLRSGNDAATIIAKNVGGSMEGFTTMMNEMAINIGMKNTYFYNAHGLEEKDGKGNTSTSYDMALLTRYAMKNKTFREIFGTKKYVGQSSTKKYHWTNKNKLLHKLDYVTGGKTGFTKKARRTLVTTASRNNINVLVVTLNDPNDFYDHQKLYEKVFKEYESKRILKKGKIKIKNEKLYNNYQLYINNDIYIPLKNNEKKDIKIDYKLYEDKKFNDKDIVGRVEVSIKDKVIRKENIYVKKEEEEKAKSWWQKIMGWFKW